MAVIDGLARHAQCSPVMFPALMGKRQLTYLNLDKIFQVFKFPAAARNNDARQPVQFITLCATVQCMGEAEIDVM